MRHAGTVVLLGFASCAFLWFDLAPWPVLWMVRRLPRGATFCLAFGAWTIGARKAPVLHVNTLYARWGDWFAWLNVLGLATMLSYRR